MPARDEAETPRDLLLGLLGLRNGMVSIDRLARALSTWAQSRDRSLGDLLIEQGVVDVALRDLLDALVDAHVQLHGGDVNRSLASLEVSADTRERLATATMASGDTDLWQTLSHMGSGMSSATSAPIEPRADGLAIGTTSREGQRFRVLRPHARGGLGAVFVALDSELNREVALKQILDHHADDPGSRQRFLVEAEITGGLEHPGIVPVYGLGCHKGGRPYYAMRFIKGDSLKTAIERYHSRPAASSLGPSEGRTASSLEASRSSTKSSATRGENPSGSRPLQFRMLLRRFLDVCNAIEYAHSRGVLHRDIKPGNVIVGRHGETLVVDWGLAKPLGRVDPIHESGERSLTPSASSGSAETLPGQALGTPAYMSPEQAAGDLDNLGPRSDVYALGATLYSLLTGRPPFEGDVHEILTKVRAGDFRRPRQLDASIDPALDAVCAKAMAREPAQRHATCRELAEDIERWMADEPVHAWREPWTRRLTRWLSRHRTGLAVAGATLLVGILGLSAVLAVESAANASLTDANARLSASLLRETRAKDDLAASNAELTRSRAAVQARYDLAVDAIQTFHTGVSEDFLLRQDQFRDLRNRLLGSASEFYGKLGALLGKETDLASRRALAASKYELASLTNRVGRKQDALAAHQTVLAAREALAAEPGADARAKIDVASSLVAVARMNEALGNPAEAMTAYERVVSSLADLEKLDASARATLAYCRSRMGFNLFSTGHPDKGLAAYELARAAQSELAAAPGSPDHLQLDLADTLNLMGMLLAETGKLRDAESRLREALVIRQRLVESKPDVAEYRNRLGESHGELAILLSRTGRSNDAEVEYRESLDIRGKLVDEFPAVAEFRLRLAGTLANIGTLSAQMGRMKEAESAYRQAIPVLQKLQDEYPKVTDYRADLGSIHSNLGGVLSDLGEPEEAESTLRKSIEIRSRLVDENPTVPMYSAGLASSRGNLAQLLTRLGRPSEAEPEYRLAAELFESLARQNPNVPEYPFRLAGTRSDYGELLISQGNLQQGGAQLDAALATEERLAIDFPTIPQIREHLAITHVNRATFLRRSGKSDQAESHYRDAMAIQRRLAANQRGNPRYRLALASTFSRLGELLESQGRLVDAEALWRDALRELQAFVGGQPASDESRASIGGVQLGLASTLARMGRPNEAEAAYRSAVDTMRELASRSPRDPDRANDLAASSSKLATLLRHLGRPNDARALVDQSIVIREALVRGKPRDATYREGLASTIRERGSMRRALGDPAGAEADARRALSLWGELPAQHGGDWLERASAHASLAATVGDADEAKRQGNLALESLRKAVAMGHRDAFVAKEDDFASLRNRDDFRLVLMDLTMPEWPFEAEPETRALAEMPTAP